MGWFEFAASLVYIRSMGSNGESGFTIVPSRRIAASRFWTLVPPSASPTPTGPADRVPIIRLGSSPLKKTSVHGHKPTALANLESYKKESHLSRSKRSVLGRIVWTFEYRVLAM